MQNFEREKLDERIGKENRAKGEDPRKENELIFPISICFEDISIFCGEVAIARQLFFFFSFFFVSGTSLTVRHCTTQVKKSKQRSVVSDS